ncbi:MAG: AAA family ATPase, partial [Acidobacteria bacterium]|nr:AAA family ATPase [Acidobacteriota bacterium]
MSPSMPHLPADLDPFAEDPGSDFDVKEYVYRIARHWPLITVVMALCLGVAAIKYFITPKAYQSKAIIQIERRSLAPLVGSQNPWLENFWNIEFYPTQERLLQSRGLAEQVVRNLHLLTDPEFGGSPRAASGEASAAADEAAVSRLARGIQGGLSVRRIRETQLVEINYVSDNGQKAAKLANGFAQAFIDMGIESRYATADQASSILGTEIETLQREISQKEAFLQDLGRRHEIVDLDPESNVTLQRLKALNQDLSEAQNQRIQKQARYRELQVAPAENVADTYSNGEIGQLRASYLQLEQEYSAKLSTYKPDFPQMVELQRRATQAREAFQSAVLENATRARESARREYQEAERQEQALAAEIESLKSQSIDQKSSRLEFLNLQDEVETKRAQLTQLRQRLSESEASVRLKETRASNVRIIDSALVPGSPYRPSLKRNLALGLLLGLGFGVGLSMLREFLDRTVKSGEELESIMRLPTLAVIPDIFDSGRPYGYGRYGYGYGYGADPKADERRSRRWLEKRKKDQPAQIELLPHDRPRLAVAEAYRSLRTALLLSSTDQLRVIAVTSAVAGEGKTATASNLAVVMAQLGKKVLVVD